MKELLDRPDVVDAAALRAGLEALEVRPSFMSRLFGTGTTGMYVPTRQEWERGRVQSVGQQIGRVLESDEARLKITSLNDAGLPRRQETLGHFGLTYELLRKEGPIHGAEVTGLAHESLGMSWNRTLPMLSIIEYNSQTSERIFAVSVTDVAYYLQSEQIDIDLV